RNLREMTLHYTPQHPLPEEIKKLARDDTVCKYCGVSYLIHNEIKVLEDKLAKLEKELATLRGQEQREALLKKENALLKDQRNDLQASLETEHNLGKFMKALREFSALSQVVRQQKQTLEQVRNQVTESREEILGCMNEAKKNVTQLAQAATNEHEELQSRVQCLDMEKLVLSQSNATLTSNLQAAEQKLAEKERELEAERDSIRKLEKYMQDSESLSESLKDAQKSLQNSQKELEVSQEKSKTYEKELEQIKVQLRSKTSEVKESGDKMNQLQKSHEVATQKELMIEAHQNRIEELRESFKNKMAEMDNWPQKLQAAVAAEKSRHQAEMKALEENLKHNFVLELQIEKDKYNELLKKFQTQEREKNNMRQSEQAQLEQKFRQEMEDLRRQVSESKARAQEREEELQAEIASLKKIINDLQNRLARLDSEGSGEATQLKVALAEVQQELLDAQAGTAGY
ncbi:hypothetical protein EGW08_011457, partial [Elysia chlorotica]